MKNTAILIKQQLLYFQSTISFYSQFS